MKDPQLRIYWIRLSLISKQVPLCNSTPSRMNCLRFWALFNRIRKSAIAEGENALSVCSAKAGSWFKPWASRKVVEKQMVRMGSGRTETSPQSYQKNWEKFWNLGIRAYAMQDNINFFFLSNHYKDKTAEEKRKIKSSTKQKQGSLSSLCSAWCLYTHQATFRDRACHIPHWYLSKSSTFLGT